MSIQALYTAATGMNSMQAKLDVISNNLANAETTGFKADRANFEDLFYRQEIYPGARTAAALHADGHRLRHRQPRTEHAEQFHPRLAATDRQCTRHGNPRQRLFPSPDPSGTIYYTRARELSRKTPTARLSSARPTSAACSNRRSPYPNDATNITINATGRHIVSRPHEPNAPAGRAPCNWRISSIPKAC